MSPSREPTNAEAQTAGQRLVGALVPLLLAVFLGCLAFGVSGADVSGPRYLSILLKGFFSAVVGGIAVFSAGVGVQTLRGRRVRSKVLPAVLETFCPRCGERSDAARVVCPGCAHPFTGRAERWSTPEHNYGATLFGLVLGGGLACLGLFVLAGPFAEGERRIWVLFATGALGLLILGVGGLMIWGGALAGLDDLRGLENWSYDWSRGGAGDPETACGRASALLRRGALLHASGQSSGAASVAVRKPRVEPLAFTRLPREGQAFVKALAMLYHAGLLGLWYEEALEWRLGSPKSEANPGDEPSVRHFASVRESLETCLLARPPSQEMQPLMELVSTQVTSTSRPVSELWLAVQSEPALTDQFDTFFRVHELSPELLEGPASLALVGAISPRKMN